MRWVMTRTIDGVKQWWQESQASAARDNVGIEGQFVFTLSEATKVPDSLRAKNLSLGAGLQWEVYANRYKDALEVQNAVNPAGVSLSLHEAFREVIREGGDTKAHHLDPACRLILHHLAHLLGMSGGYDMADYHKYVTACEAHIRNQTVRTIK